MMSSDRRDRETSEFGGAPSPDLATGEAKRMRHLLAAAGLLASTGVSRRRPSERALESARRAATSGAPLSEIVSKERE